MDRWYLTTLKNADVGDIPEGVAHELTEAQRVELERRIADYEANPNDVVPWEEVKAEVRERTAKKAGDGSCTIL